MLASTLAGEANAAAVIRDLLKHDELVKLPAAEPPAPVVLAPPPTTPSAEAIKARRHEQKRKKQAERPHAAREQSARATRPHLTRRRSRSRQRELEAEHLALVVQQPRLRLQSTAEPDERAVAADHAVARHDDRQRVLAVGGADGPGLPRQPDAAACSP